MDLMQIKGFHLIDDESRMPEITEDGKFPKWDNDLGVFVYVNLQDSGDDLYVSNIVQEGNIVTITRNDNTEWTITLPSDPEEFGLALPGDTMILFHEIIAGEDVIGGRSNLTYNYTTNSVILTNSPGIFGRNTSLDIGIQSIVQYLGNNNLYINFGEIKTPSANMENNTAIGYNSLKTLQTGDANIGLGYKAGADVATTMSNSVFIGSYAGRIEQDDNRLYIHSGDFSSLQDFKDQSLIYGEFDNGLLYVNNRLHIREEVRIGEFDENNAPLGGMVRMTSANNALVKPQWYDNVEWRDFASDSNFYLDEVTLVNTSEYVNTITFNVYGYGVLTLAVPDTHLTVAGDIYDVQLNNGAGDLAASSNFNFNINTDVLLVDGVIQLPTHEFGDFSANDGVLINTGLHVYMYLNGVYKQLDNEPSDGQTNEGENIGTGVPVFAGMNIDNHNLQFYNLIGSAKLVIADADVNNDILFEVDYTVNGANLGNTGSNLYVNTTDTSNSSTLNFKQLYSSDGSVIITEQSTYLDLTTNLTPTATGEITTASNEGAGEGLFIQKVFIGGTTYNLEFRTLVNGANIVINQVGNTIEISSKNDVYSIDEVGSEETIIKETVNDIDGFTHTFIFKTIKAGANIILTANADTLQIDATGGAGNGEANDGENIGLGDFEWYKQMNGVHLQFKTFGSIPSVNELNPYDRITFTDTLIDDTILIGTTAELNTAINYSPIGTYASVYADKVDEQFQFRVLKAGANIILTEADEYIQIDAVPGDEFEQVLYTIQNTGSGYGWWKGRVGTVDYLRTIIAGDNIEIVDNVSSLIINAIDVGEVASMYNSDGGAGIVSANRGLVYSYRDAPNHAFYFRSIKAGPLDNITVTTVGQNILLDAKVGTAGEMNTCSNIGGYEEIYKDKQGVNFRFKTLKEGTNIQINNFTDYLELTVPHLVNDAISLSGGIDVYKTYTEVDEGVRILNFSPLLGIDDIEVALNGDVIEIGLDTDIKIPAIEGVILPVSTNIDKTLTWHLIYDENIRNTNPTTEDILQLNLGSNLIYNSLTNTLDAIGGSSGDPLVSVENLLITRNVDGTVDRASSNRNVRFTRDSGVYIDWDGETSTVIGLGWLAFENDYPIATDTSKGILEVSTTNGLTIIDGVLDIDLPSITPDRDSVLFYPPMYKLHDEDNFTNNVEDVDQYGGSPEEGVNTRRKTARQAIGAAYVNGSFDEDFRADTLSVSGSAETTGTYIEDNTITSDWGNIKLIKGLSEVSVADGIIDITVDPRNLPNDLGAINFYMYNTGGSKIKVASITSRYEGAELVADFKVKGNFKFHCTDEEMG